MKIPFVSLLVRNNWVNPRSDEVQYLDNWELMGCIVSFLCCFKGTGFKNKVVYFELGISWVGTGVWFLLPLCGLAGDVLQKHHQTSSKAEAEPYATYDWNLHLPKALKSSHGLDDNPANCLNLVKRDECCTKSMCGYSWILESMLVTAVLLILTFSIEKT